MGSNSGAQLKGHDCGASEAALERISEWQLLVVCGKLIQNSQCQLTPHTRI